MEFWPTCSTSQEKHSTLTGAATSGLAIGAGTLRFSGPQFPQQEYEGVRLDVCQDPFSLKMQEPVNSYSFLCAAQSPVVPAVT